jgi:hypothetical protein
LSFLVSRNDSQWFSVRFPLEAYSPMEEKEKSGFITLAKQSLTVITASLGALMSGQSNASPAISKIDVDAKNINVQSYQSEFLSPPLILKLNRNNANAMSILHVSHSSHSSHSSHYSSSPGYNSSPDSASTSNNPLPDSSSKSNNPPPKVVYMPLAGSNQTSSSTTSTTDGKLAYYLFGSRSLRRGDNGTDVQQLQAWLAKVGYDVLPNGFFGESTELAVLKFQIAGKLKPDGVADSLTQDEVRSQAK